MSCQPLYLLRLGKSPFAFACIAVIHQVLLNMQCKLLLIIYAVSNLVYGWSIWYLKESVFGILDGACLSRR